MSINSLSFPIWLKVLVVIDNNKNTTNTFIAKKLNVTYNHIFSIINFLVVEKYITKKRTGRICQLATTTKGHLIAKKFNGVVEE